MEWTWANASDKERGDWVRHHAAIGRVCPKCLQALPGKALTTEALCSLFDLDEPDLADVLAGADYPTRRIAA